MKKSWKTTLFGVLSAAGLALAGGMVGDNPNLKKAGEIIAAVGTLGTGLAAKDSNVTGGTKIQ